MTIRVRGVALAAMVAACGWAMPAVAQFLPSNVIAVSANGLDDPFCGETWNVFFGPACRTLPYAIARALNSNGAITQIWITAGSTVAPWETVASSSEPGAVQVYTITIPPNIAVYGGFNGNESSLAGRPANGRTTIAPLVGTENGVRVRMGAGSVLDGFRITQTGDGQPTGLAFDGVVLESGATLRNSRIEGTQAPANTAYLRITGDATISNVEVSGTADGAGSSLFAADAASLTPSGLNVSGTASGTGASIATLRNSAVVSGVTIGGAATVGSTSVVTVRDTATLRNATVNGEARVDDTAVVRLIGSSRLEDTTVTATALAQGHAGVVIAGDARMIRGSVRGITTTGSAGIRVDSGSPVLRGVSVSENRSRTAAVRATPGTIFLNGQINSNVNLSSNPAGTAAMVGGQLIGSVVYGNTSTGGLAAVRNTRIINSTIVDNGIRGVIGGRLFNSIVWGNGRSLQNNLLPGQISGIDDASMRHNIIQGWRTTPSTNIGSDPMFFNAPAGIFSPLSSSPAIDSGNNSLVPRGLFTDLSGKRRFATGGGLVEGAGDNPVIDRGAFEFDSVPFEPAARFCYADFDGNGELDAQDLAEFMELMTIAHPLADANADGVVNAADLVRFNDLTTTGCP